MGYMGLWVTLDGPLTYVGAKDSPKDDILYVRLGQHLPFAGQPKEAFFGSTLF